MALWSSRSLAVANSFPQKSHRCFLSLDEALSLVANRTVFLGFGDDVRSPGSGFQHCVFGLQLQSTVHLQEQRHHQGLIQPHTVSNVHDHKQFVLTQVIMVKLQPEVFTGTDE